MWVLASAIAVAQIGSGATLPSNCNAGGGSLFYLTSGDAGLYVCQSDVWTKQIGPGGGAAWGGITGTLANQTDLQTALNAKGSSNFSGAYADLTGKPTLGTAAATASSDYATAAQGAKADSAVQPNGNVLTATSLANARLINGVAFNGSVNITVPAAGSTLTDNVPFNRGGIGGCAATSATTGTMTVSMTTRCITITPTGAATFNASGGVAGQMVTFSITTQGVSSFVLTFGTNFRKTGTLATGTVAARFFAVTFLCLDGVIWQEIARTAVQT